MQIVSQFVSIILTIYLIGQILSVFPMIFFHFHSPKYRIVEKDPNCWTCQYGVLKTMGKILFYIWLWPIVMYAFIQRKFIKQS